LVIAGAVMPVLAAAATPTASTGAATQVSQTTARLNAQVELAGRSRKGQLKHADRLGARYVAVVGEATTMLKEMAAGEQRDVPTTAVVARILRDRGIR